MTFPTTFSNALSTNSSASNRSSTSGTIVSPPPAQQPPPPPAVAMTTTKRTMATRGTTTTKRRSKKAPLPTSTRGQQHYHGGRGGTGGGTRKPVQQRGDTDDTSCIIGANHASDEQYEAAHTEIVKRGISDKCHRDYRCRIARIIKWLETNFPEYVEAGGIQNVSHEDLTNERLFYFGHFEKDLVYTGLNVAYILRFLMCNDRKSDGKLKSSADMRKYRDAIVWGSKVRNEWLPRSFFTEMELFNDSYKKKISQAKQNGEVEESSTDPIVSEKLYVKLLKWAIIVVSMRMIVSMFIKNVLRS